MPNVVAELKITMTDAGEVNVSGPIENKIIAYGLLDIARDVVKEHNDNKDKRVQPATAAERLALLAGGRKSD